jgi:hypothetical protein
MSMQPLRRAKHVAVVTTGVIIVALMASFQSAIAQSGSGAVHINARACGAAVQADVSVRSADADAREVAKGPSGQPISVPAGTYDIEITCTDLVDHPNQTLTGVKIGGGETLEREASFECGVTTLHVKLGGKVLKGTKMVLTPSGGEECPGKVLSGEPFKASPGEYRAEIRLGKGRTSAVHSIDGIQVYDGATRNIPVSL